METSSRFEQGRINHRWIEIRLFGKCLCIFGTCLFSSGQLHLAALAGEIVTGGMGCVTILQQYFHNVINNE